MSRNSITFHERNPLADHCGIVAAYAAVDIQFFTRGLIGLQILQTRGYDGAGFWAQDMNGQIYQHKGTGMIREIFSPAVANQFRTVKGSLWVYQVRYGTVGAHNPLNVQPLSNIHLSTHEVFIIAHNGQFSHEGGPDTDGESDTVRFARQLAKSNGSSWDTRVVECISMKRGAWSLVIGTSEGLYVARDSFGFRPFVYGHLWDEETKQFVWVGASETSALESIGITDFYELVPGTIAKITAKGLEIIKRFPTRRTLGLCIFENVYIHHGASKSHLPRTNPRKIRQSPSVDDVRRRSGRILAREAPLSKKDVDIVIGVPGTGIEGGMSYGQALDIPYVQAITDKVSVPEEQRTFMMAQIENIYDKVLQHFNFDGKAVSGKRIVLVDDSIIRGNIAKGLIYLLKQYYKVTSVHLRVLCPPIDKPCHLGINTRSSDELIAAKHLGDIERIRQELGAESLAYLSTEGLKEAVTGNPYAQGFCMGCMVGHAPPVDWYGNPTSNVKLLKRNYQTEGSPSGRPRVLFTDGEGPLVYKDLAFDVMSRLTFSADGQRIPGSEAFAFLSLYDDYKTETGIAGYQAGDTLALVVPHFLAHGVTNEDIGIEAKAANLVPGVREYLAGLQNDAWSIRIISTAYRPLWEMVGKLLHVPSRHIACTELDLQELRNHFYSAAFARAVVEAEREVFSQRGKWQEAVRAVNAGKSVTEIFGDNGHYRQLRERLDQFYWKELLKLGYQPLEAVRVVGGKRKVDAAKQFAEELGVPLSALVYVGDSITDEALFAHLNCYEGLSIAVNGNAYALRNARVAVATLDMRALRPLLDAWATNGLTGVTRFILQQESFDEDQAHYAFVDTKDTSAWAELVGIHKRLRATVRGKAAALG